MKKNHFVDFILLDENDDPQVWAAMAEYNFYRLPEEKEDPDNAEIQDDKSIPDDEEASGDKENPGDKES